MLIVSGPAADKQKYWFHIYQSAGTGGGGGGGGLSDGGVDVCLADKCHNPALEGEVTTR